MSNEMVRRGNVINVRIPKRNDNESRSQPRSTNWYRFLITLVVTNAILMWWLWGFWLEFILLTILYVALAVVIVMALERSRGREPGDYLHRNNNTWFFVGCAACAITFLIACFNFGPALLLPERLPTPEQQGDLSYFFSHLWLGKNAPAMAVPTDPLPWATGTWFWWKALVIYMVLTFDYFWFAFWDEGVHAVRFVANVIEGRLRDHHNAHKATSETGGVHSGWEIFTLAFVAELVGSFFIQFWEHRRRNHAGTV